MEATICQICKEPTGNMVCIACLAEDIRCWLPGSLSFDFQRFTERLLETFQYTHDGADRHLRHTAHGFMCSSAGCGTVCLHCYT